MVNIIKRKAFKLIDEAMNEYVIPILFGLRRVGKTEILKQIKLKYHSKKIEIISWDYFELKVMSDIEFFTFIKKKCDENEIVLFDEVQDRKYWDIMIKNLFDQYSIDKKCKIVVTGLSSLILNNKELGVNRTRRIFIDTWDFDEYLEFTQKTRNIENFEDFLGRGFPDLMKKEKNNFNDNLENILKPIIFEDIKNQFPKLDALLLLRFIVYISKLTNGEVNESNLSIKLGIQRITVRNYFDILEKANLLKKIFRINENGSFSKNKKYKIYLNPHFHVWLLKNKFKNLDPKVKGHIIESYWLNRVLTNYNFRKEFYYIKNSKTGKEIDLVSLNDDSSFKTLHEFKYKNKISNYEIKHLTSIKATNKIIWTKNQNENHLMFKSISIIES